MNHAGIASPRIGGNLPSASEQARRSSAESPGAINGSVVQWQNAEMGAASRPVPIACRNPVRFRAEPPIDGRAARKDVQQDHGSKPRATADLLGGIRMWPAGVESRPCLLSVRSSTGQSNGLLSRLVQVRVLPGGPNRGVAQW